MGVTLSGELSGLLAEAGGRWPEADEDRLHEVADSWRTLAQDLRTTAAEGTAIAGRVSAVNTGPAVDAFSAYWTELRGDLEQAATAAEQTAEGVDAMARGTLGAKKSIVGALQATHSEIQSAQSMPVVGAVAGPAIALLLGILLRFILRILAALLKLIWKFIVWLFKKIAQFFKWLWNKLFGPKPKDTNGKGDKDDKSDAGGRPEVPELKIDDQQFGQKVGKHTQDYGLIPPIRHTETGSGDTLRRSAEIQMKSGKARGIRRAAAARITSSSGEATMLSSRSATERLLPYSTFVTILKDGINNGWFKGARQ